MSTDTPQPFKPAKGRPCIAEMLIRNRLAGHTAVRAEMRRQLCADIARAEAPSVVAGLAEMLGEVSA